MAYDLATIVVSGNLLSNDFLHSSKQPGNRLGAFDPGTFNPEWQTPTDFDRTLAQAWDDLKDRFDSIQGELLRMDTSTLRNQWLLPVLRTLGFSPVFQKAHTRLKNVAEVYPISHRGWDGSGAPAIHLVGIQEDLDLKPTEREAKSPQMMLQSYLNQDATQHWAILSNGFVLRLLRDYFHTSQPGFVQFNLYEMFLTREYDEFRSLYRLAHASRFKPRGKVLAPVIMATPSEASDEAEDDEAEGGATETEVVQEAKELPIWLEVLYEHARSEGSRAEANLRDNVKRALELLGHGLLTPDLRETLADAAELETYYRQLLRVVYRSIFLLFAEQRGLIPGAASHAELYREEYSLTALRNLSEEQRFVRDTGFDLWERLLLTFELARTGNSALGVQPFNGNLFDRSNIYLITGACHDLSERNRRDDLPRLSNDDSLKFIECLGFTDAGGVKERINYRDLKVEEIGHIYESLLDYAPRIAEQDLQLAQGFIPRGTFFLDMGTERKSTGSYYTPKELVQEVISRALIPVMDERVDQAGDSLEAKEKALLSIRVLDPACGSAAFLIAANDTLAQRLADLRWQAKGGAGPQATADEIKETFEDEVQHAKRDVLAHCIYGVDYNDMAVELAQVALWINAASAGYPLSFLDHRIKHGNSLVGAPLNFLQLGIHPDAYKGRGDADAEKLKEIRKGFTKKELDKHRAQMQGKLFNLAVEIPDLDSVEERGTGDVQRKAELYHSFRERGAYKKWQLVADYWTSTFFYPVKPGVGHIPNQMGLNGLLQSFEQKNAADLLPQGADGRLIGNVAGLKQQYRFFHYWLEFPEVFFEPHGEAREGGGFDVIVGNPPWERVKLQEKEFFSTRDAAIAGAANASKRKKLIEALGAENPDLYRAFGDALVEADATSNFLRVSGRYPLGGVGDVNTYQVFTENARDLTGEAGRTGIIVPSGIAIADSLKLFFRELMESQSLVCLLSFFEIRKLFPGTDSREPFCILVLSNSETDRSHSTEFVFSAVDVQEVHDARRVFRLSAEEIRLLNPNTQTCPVFRTDTDARLTIDLYRSAGTVFQREYGTTIDNPWRASFSRMFDMTNDSSLFRTSSELQADGYVLAGNRFHKHTDVFVPLYESKLVNLFNHRFATIDNGVSSRIALVEELKDASYAILPRYWVHEDNYKSAIANRTTANYLYGCSKHCTRD